MLRILAAFVSISALAYAQLPITGGGPSGSIAGANARDFTSSATWTFEGSEHDLGTCDLKAVAFITATSTWQEVAWDKRTCETAAGGTQYDVVVTWAGAQAGRLVLLRGGTGSGGSGGGGVTCFLDTGTSGILVRTSNCGALARAIAGTTDEITVVNGSGADGNPTLSLSATLNLASKIVIVPSSTTLPATCAVGQFYMDTDAPTGKRLYACETTNTWVLQGDGAGSGSGDISAVGNCATGDCLQAESDNKVFASPANGSSGQMLSRLQVSADVPLSFPGYIEGSSSLVFSSSIADGDCDQKTFTLTGATPGTSGPAAAATALAVGLNVQLAKVTALNTVGVEICNMSGSSATPGTITFTVVLVGSAYR